MKIKLLLISLLILSCSFVKEITQDSVNVTELYPGIKFHHIINTDTPLNITALEIDITNPSISIEVGIANDRLGFGGELTSAFVNRNQNDSIIIVGAVNGDFFGGTPHAAENCMIVNGELAKGVKLNRTLFGITKDKIPFVEKIQFNGKVVYQDDTLSIGRLNHKPENFTLVIFNKFYNDNIIIDSGYVGLLLSDVKLFSPNIWLDCLIKNISYSASLLPVGSNESVLLIPIDSLNNMNELEIGQRMKIYLGTEPLIENNYSLIGGLPRLVTDGERPESFIGSEGLTSERFVAENPRTAVGFSKDRTKLFIAVVDGRQENISAGIPLTDLAEFLISMGCYQAVNLDGGGSSTMVVNNKVVNFPSDKTGERPVHNFLYVTYRLN
jgi:phosphodiester glycosidase